MEIRVLRYFLEVAELGSASAAAKRLHLTQPTLSRQLRDLESELGVTLFERHSHSMSLTPEGTALRRRALQIIELADETEREMNILKEKSLGDVRIAGADTIHTEALMRAVRAFQDVYPKSRVHMICGNYNDIIQRFDGGLVDFAIWAPPISLEKYRSITLPAKERWVLYTRKENPLALKDRITIEDLLDEPLILSGHIMRENEPGNPLVEWFGKAFGQLDVRGTFNLPFLGGEMVKGGIGSLITWAGLLDVSSESPLTAVPLYPPVYDVCHLCWLRNTRLSPAAAELLEFIEAEIPGKEDE